MNRAEKWEEEKKIIDGIVISWIDSVVVNLVIYSNGCNKRIVSCDDHTSSYNIII